MRLFLLVSMISILFLGCDSSDPDDDNEGMLQGTSMEVQVDGDDWEAEVEVTAALSGQIGDIRAAIINGVIGNLATGTYEQILVQVLVNTEERTYMSTNELSIVLTRSDNSVARVYGPGEVELTITEFTETTLAGTFSATLANIMDAADIVELTGGTFTARVLDGMG